MSQTRNYGSFYTENRGISHDGSNYIFQNNFDLDLIVEYKKKGIQDQKIKMNDILRVDYITVEGYVEIETSWFEKVLENVINVVFGIFLTIVFLLWYLVALVLDWNIWPVVCFLILMAALSDLGRKQNEDNNKVIWDEVRVISHSGRIISYSVDQNHGVIEVDRINDIIKKLDTVREVVHKEVEKQNLKVDNNKLEKVKCNPCQGKGYLEDEDIKRWGMEGDWSPGRCKICDGIGKVDPKDDLPNLMDYIV